MLSFISKYLAVGFVMMAVVLAVSINLTFKYYIAEKVANEEISRLNAEAIEQSKEIERQFSIIAQAEKNKQSQTIKSEQLQDNLSEALKNNQCANDLVPDSVSDILYKRASDLRQTENTTQSTN